MAKGGGGPATHFMVGLLVAMIGVMGLLVLAYERSQEVEGALERVREAEDEVARQRRAVVDLAKEVREARRLITGREDEPVAYGPVQTTHLDPARGRLDELLAQEWLAIDEWRTIQDPAIKGVWEALSKHRAKAGARPTHLTGVVEELHDQLAAVMHVVPTLRHDRAAAQVELEAIRGAMVRELAAKQRELEELRERRSTLTDEGIELARRADAEKRRLQGELEALRATIAALEREARLTEARRRGQLSQHEGRIEDLTRQPARTFAGTAHDDGEVVLSDAALGCVWIDIGRRDGLRPGTRFEVYDEVRAGAQRIKGVIEVRRVEEDMARCAIVLRCDEQLAGAPGGRGPSGSDPIAKGDRIRSPFFDAGATPTFAFLGSSLRSRAHDLREVQRRLEAAGARGEARIGAATSFAIVLGDPDEDADLAEQVRVAARSGAIVLREGELLTYLGR